MSGVKIVLASTLLAFGVFAQSGWAQAPAYPAKIVRIVIPFPTGGGFDGIARPFSERLGAILGQPVVLDFRPGAGSTIGTEYVARAAADGYTLLVGNVAMTSTPAMWKTLNYDVVSDFAPITRLGFVSSALAIHPSVPARDLKELMALSKLKPITFGTPGVGTVAHLMGEMMNLEGSLHLRHISYKGSAQAITDAIGGHLDAVMLPLQLLVPHIRAGRLRGIAGFSPKRVALLPELPTFVETGFPQVQYETWYALFAPAGTPEAVLKRLHEASVQVLAQPGVIEQLRKAGYEPGSSTPEALAALVKSEVIRWNRMATEAKIPKQ